MVSKVDEGKEFMSSFADFCRAKGIKIYFSTTKVKSGRVENLNGVIKLLVHRIMTQYNSQNFAKFLPLALRIYNSRSTKGLPSPLTPLTALNPKNASKIQQFYLERRANLAKRAIKKHPHPKFLVGDTVRKEEKAKFGRHRGFEPRFSKALYTVSYVTKSAPRGYYLEHVMKGGKPQFFYEHQLRLAHEGKFDNPQVLTILSSKKVVLSRLRNGKPNDEQILYLTVIQGKEKAVYLTEAELLGYKYGDAKLKEFKDGNHRP